MKGAGNLKQFLSEYRSRVVKDGILKGSMKAAYYTYVGLFNTLTTRWPRGTNVYERDWDVLVLLDSCRVDVMREVADEYEFIEEVETLTSVGSTSDEWMAKTFTEPYAEEVKQTAYVTGNVFTETHRYPPRDQAVPFSLPNWKTCDKRTFAAFEEVWRSAEAWTEFDGDGQDGSYIGPGPVVDRAIQIHRERTPARMIVHLMQPHPPFVRAAEDADVHTPIGDAFNRYRRGELDRDEMWALFRANTRFVLDEVAVLLDNVDADTVVISADHGESFSPFIGHHQVAHPYRSVKVVPWVETSATDSDDYEPSFEGSADVDVDPKRRLDDMGYL